MVIFGCCAQGANKDLNSRMRRQIIFLLLLTSCNGLTKTRQLDYAKEKERVENCRRGWTLLDLTEATSIKLLLQDEKGRYHMSSWPNFYIGIDNKGDTIGLVENISEIKFKPGTVLTFSEYEGQKDFSRALYMHPILKVSKRTKDNDLYCSVNRVYYARLKN